MQQQERMAEAKREHLAKVEALRREKAEAAEQQRQATLRDLEDKAQRLEFAKQKQELDIKQKRHMQNEQVGCWVCLLCVRDVLVLAVATTTFCCDLARLLLCLLSATAAPIRGGLRTLVLGDDAC